MISADGAKLYLYNLIMVVNGEGKVLVLDRIKTEWPGLTFPGGHVEKGEGLAASAIREVKEETGLTVSSVTPCGIVHWADPEKGHRCMEFLYRTSAFTGTPCEGSTEGKVLWMDPDELRTSDRLSPNFVHYLPLFLDGGYSELFFEWDGENWEGVPRYFSYEA